MFLPPAINHQHGRWSPRGPLSKIIVREVRERARWLVVKEPKPDIIAPKIGSRG